MGSHVHGCTAPSSEGVETFISMDRVLRTVLAPRGKCGEDRSQEQLMWRPGCGSSMVHLTAGHGAEILVLKILISN